ncbi:MAG: DUF6174 domain-containing protein [Ardenticatenaceae bacterium]|nr:DUF6174 domain-containing protein [Ardenticatenaceae bacterium]
MHYKYLAVLFLGAILLSGCFPAEVQPVPENEAASGGIDRGAAAATAEASATSTVMVDYLDEVQAAVDKWAAAEIDSYTLELNYNEGQGGFQVFKLTVEDGDVTEFKHTCTPAQNCLLIKVENESDFTVNGLMTMLTDLGEQQIPLAILRFNDQYGIPEAITTNSDESPILRMVRVESFEPIAD